MRTAASSETTESRPARVLLWARMTSHFREMLRVARVLARTADYEPVMLFDYPYFGHESEQAQCDREGIAWILQSSRQFIHGPPVRKKAITGAEPQPFVTWLPARARRSFLARGVRALRYLNARYVLGTYGSVRARLLPRWTALRGQRHHLRQAHRLLEIADPQLLVLPEDNVEFPTAALVKAGHERGVPTVVIPYTICNAAEPAESYFAARTHQADTPRNRQAAAQFPRWVYRHRGRDLIRLPGPDVLAKEALGLAPPLPWVFNSGHADAIVVESTALKDYYLRAGLPERQIRVLGSARLDDLAAAQQTAPEERRRLSERFGWAETGPVIVTAVPPNQRPRSRPGCEFTSYEDLIAFWVGTLADVPGGRVVINPHPRGDTRALYGLERSNVRVAEGDVSRLIPLCDLYVASVSATIPMALAAGKPVVNYDVYRYGYDDFAASSLVRTVVSRADYCAELQNWQRGARCDDTDAPDESWGKLDGLSGSRLIGLLDELLAAQVQQPSARKAG